MELKAVPPVDLKLELSGTQLEFLTLAEALVSKKRTITQKVQLAELAASLRDLADPLGDDPPPNDQSE